MPFPKPAFSSFPPSTHILVHIVVLHIYDLKIPMHSGEI
jgi:hypothetical protein